MKCIKVLCVEDRPADAELIELHLKRSDMQVVFHLVDSRDAYVEALENFVPDVITCDHALPSFNSFDALKLLQQTSLSVPFIVISGTLTEDQAIELVREGADDFLLKDNLRRLPLTVVNLVEKYSFENERSLLLKKVVAKEISSKRKLCRLNEKLLLATKAAGLSIWEYHIEKNELKYDSSFPAVIGIAEKDCGNTLESWVRLVHPDDRPLMYNAMHQCIHYAKGIHVEYRVIVSDGTVKFVRVTGVLQCLLAGKGHKLVGTIQDITAAKQKQHELAYSEERYRSICENSIDAIFLSSTNGTILAANAAAQKMFGMPEEEIRQAGRAKLVVHDDSFIRLINERNKKGCAQGVINMVRKDGQVFPAHISTNSFQGPDGKNLATTIVRDISEQVRLENAVERERQRYTDLFKEAPACVGVLSGPDHVFEMANPLYLKVTGRDSSIIGKPVREAFPEVEAQGIVEILNLVYKTGEQYSARELCLKIRKNNAEEYSDIYFDFVYMPYKNEKGEVTAIFFFANDVTEQVNLRREVEESENSYRQLFEMSPVAKFLVRKATMQIVKTNNVARKLYGYSSEEFLTMKFSDLSKGYSSVSVQDFLSSVVNSTEAAELTDNHISKTGNDIIVRIQAVPFSFLEDDCCLIDVSDLTEKTALKRSLAALKKSAQKKILQSHLKGQEAERQLLGKELHDNVNQLLCTAQLYLNLARNDQSLRDELIIKSEQIVQNAIGEIRSLSKSLVAPMLRDADLTTSIKELIDTYAVTQTFKIHFNADELVNRVDRELQFSFYRMVQEQLTNITKYAEAKNVWIQFCQSEGVLECTIKDDGKGFDPKSKGRGVGLQNIKSRTELFDGKFRINSSPGHGCSLHITIPVHSSVAAVTSAPVNILVAEDDVLDQELIRKAMLAVNEKSNIVFVENGKEVFRYLEAASEEVLPSLIILDYNMPVMNAYETLRKLNGSRRYRDIPKVVYSTTNHKQYVDQCLSADALAYIKKGVTIDEMQVNMTEMMKFCSS